ncbi:MAG: sulfite reductase flavoprotein subunit alpha [Planctomycetota bacterium]
MSTIPSLPADAPFNPDQKQWLSGYMAGIVAAAKNLPLVDNPGAAGQPAAPAAPLSVLYGSQSGNAEALSKDLRKHASANGFEPKVAELNDISLDDLAGMERAVIVCSTFGEGDPPDNAMKFFDAVMADDAPKLDKLQYSVCGLGDSSYTHFNKAATDLDARLEALGATRVSEMVGCDVAYEEEYADWKASVFSSEQFAAASGGTAATAPAEDAAEAGSRYDKSHPFPATLLESRCLNGEGSAKEVNHVAISLAGLDDSYEAGDALGVWPVNCRDEVQEILDAANCLGGEVLTLKSVGPLALRTALLTRLDIITVTPKTLEALGIDPADDEAKLAEHGAPKDRHVADVLQLHAPDITPQQLADALRPLQPRLYSIASSPDAHPGEVHLTVGAVRYDLMGRPRKGVASTFLADRCPEGGTLGVYVHKSPHFRPPTDPDVPMIMVGPGTGIAPFRAFLEHRQATEAKGPNWLFFGDQHEASDFLYREELTAMQDAGLLTSLSLAWSRDGDQKVYVQDKMMEAAEELWAWFEKGGHFYVCGDASRMAGDVDKALIKIASEQGGMSFVDAGAWVESLRESHRYQRDVY